MIIGLTGGVGSGKSTVSEYLKSKGYAIIDCDGIARTLTEAGSPVIPDLVMNFGSDILKEDGSVDRRLLGSRAFSDDMSMVALNVVMSPVLRELICAEIERRRTEHPDELTILDAPLLYEYRLETLCDKVWVVACSEKARIRRVMERDGRSEREVRKIISKQMEEKDKIERADAVLDNNGSVEDLKTAVDALLEE